MRHRSDRLGTGRKHEIHYRHWQPVEAPCRTLLVVHGLGDHGGRYEHLARAAVARGWEVIAPDLRGHGLSHGRRGHVGRFEDYFDDLEAVLTERSAGGAPLAVFGHSMGGLVAARWVATGRVAPAALALTSPLFGLVLPVSRFWKTLGWVLNPMFPWASFNNGLSEFDSTRDTAMRAERCADALAHNRVSARWFCQVTAAIEKALDDAANLHVPLLFLQAGDDRVVCAEAGRRFFDAAASSDKQFRIYYEHYHELLREITREAEIDELLDWLDDRAGGMVPGERPRLKAVLP